MEKENIMPIVLGSSDRVLISHFRKNYGTPVVLLDTKFSLLQKISPSLFCIKMTSDTPDIVKMYIRSLPEGTDRIPLLAADEKYRSFVSENGDELASICLMWHENFKF